MSADEPRPQDLIKAPWDSDAEGALKSPPAAGHCQDEAEKGGPQRDSAGSAGSAQSDPFRPSVDPLCLRSDSSGLLMLSGGFRRPGAALSEY